MLEKNNRYSDKFRFSIRKQAPDENSGDETFINTAIDKSVISFDCLTFYRKQLVNKFGHCTIDKTQKEYCNIPFLYCPICGTKTKQNIIYQKNHSIINFKSESQS